MRRRFTINNTTSVNINKYMTIVALEDNVECTIPVTNTIDSGLIRPVFYSINGEKWIETTGINLFINKGETVSIKAFGIHKKDLEGNLFNIKNKYSLIGNIMSLIYADNIPEQSIADKSLSYLFFNTSVVEVSPNFLPATTLAEYCYYGMFSGCTSLTEAPELPATTLTDCCYEYMFRNCTSLINAPKLPATTLAYNCYYRMFENTNIFPDCSNIDFSRPDIIESGGLRGLFAGTNITDEDLYNILPINPNTGNYWLPATTLARSCYSSMFSECTSLTTAPELPATTLTDYCYNHMFYGCSNLNYVKALFTNDSLYNISNEPLYTSSWLSGVSSTGTFVKSKDATWNVRNDNGVPIGWTVVNDGEESEEGGLTTFYLNDEVKLYKMKASPGMTWEDWINSTYVPTEGDLINFRLYNMGNYYNAIMLYHELASHDMFIYEEDGLYQNVYSHNKIENGKTYLIH